MASEGEEGRTRDPLMLLLNLDGVTTDKNCSKEALEVEENERQECVLRGLRGLEQETSRQWELESPCWDSGERACPKTILCSRLPSLATACAHKSDCFSASEASMAAKMWRGKAELLVKMLGIKCSEEALPTKVQLSEGIRPSLSSLNLAFCFPMFLHRL